MRVVDGYLVGPTVRGESAVAQGNRDVQSNTRVVFGTLFRLERTRRGLTQVAIVDRLDADAYREDGDEPPAWANKAPSWLSHVESGHVAKLDRTLVTALCRALGCAREERTALLLAAGLSPYPIPAAASDDEMLRWYRAAAAALPRAAAITVAVDRAGIDGRCN